MCFFSLAFTYDDDGITKLLMVDIEIKLVTVFVVREKANSNFFIPQIIKIYWTLPTSQQWQRGRT